jgi:hypothetical protein
MEQHRETDVTFLKEQDGLPERQLKRALVQVFGTHDVERAYLVRALVGKNEGVVLGLVATEDAQLVADVAAVFHALFGTESHLNVLFLSVAQQAEIASACRPFHGAA